MYESYYGSEAFKVAVWSLEEQDRIKASRIRKAADNMETRYRDTHPGCELSHFIKPRDPERFRTLQLAPAPPPRL